MHDGRRCPFRVSAFAVDFRSKPMGDLWAVAGEGGFVLADERQKQDAWQTEPEAAGKCGTSTGPAAGRQARVTLGDWLVLHCLGFGACWGWVHVAFFSAVFWTGSGEELSLTAWLVNVLANGCAMVVFGCLSVRCAPLGARRGLVVALVALTVVGTVGLAWGSALSDAWVYLSSAFSGVGTAGLLLLWAEEYRGISPTYAKRRTIPASMIMGVFYYLLISMLPPVAAVVATMFLPVVSVVLLRLTRRMERGDVAEEAFGRADPESDAFFCDVHGVRRGRLRNAVRYAVPVRFVAFTAVYCLAPGFMRGHTSALPFASAGGIGEATFAGVAIVMVAVAVASVALLGAAKIDLAYKLVVPLMAAGLLLLPFLGAGQETLAAVAIMSGYILFEMYVWASLVDRASNVSAPTALVFGLGKSGMNVGLVAGTFVGFYFGSSSSMLLVGVLVFIVYLFIVMENAASPGIGVALSPSLVDQNAQGDVAPGKVTIAEAAQMNLSEVFNAMLDDVCAAVSETYGLSKREAQVLALLARGRSLQSIADALCVAYSTVKTHTDRIYAKTGVHSRQELIDLLERSGQVCSESEAGSSSPSR